MGGCQGTQTLCSIIIVTYNSRSSITACLAPLVNLPGIEVIVVDNHSGDETVAYVKEQFPSVILIALQDNLGFGRSCNIGVAASGGFCILFLNPDAIASAQTIRTFLDTFEKYPRAGIVGGRLIDPSGLPLQSIGDRPTLVGLILEKPLKWLTGHLNPEGRLHRAIGRYFAKLRVSYEAEPVAWVSGAALSCRRQVWSDTGGFDEKFFLYYEDVDLCLRAAQQGWEIWHVPAAVVIHQSGASFAGNRNYQKRIYYANQRYFFHKHQGPVMAGLITIAQKFYCWRPSLRKSVS
jgi:GT2 family glycosyltransferase